jgi:hypothetical protein
MRSHAALERLAVRRPVIEPRRNAQSANLIAGSPCFPDLVRLAFQFSGSAYATFCYAFSGAFLRASMANFGAAPAYQRIPLWFLVLKDAADHPDDSWF